MKTFKQLKNEINEARSIDESMWITPRGKIVDLNGDRHIKHIVNNPKFYGFTLEELEKRYEKNNEKFGAEGNTRKNIIEELIRKGWVQIRLITKPEQWNLNLNSIGRKEKDAIQKWATKVLKKDRFRPVRIFELKTGNFQTHTVLELSQDVLFQ